MKFRVLFAVALTACTIMALPAARAAERSEVPEKYKWDLAALYPDEAAWVAAKQKLVKDIPELAKWQGKLGASPGSLLAGMQAWEDVSVRADRLYAYASQLYDQDTRISRSQQMQQEGLQVYTDLQAATAFMRPEILAIGRATIDRDLAAEPKLAQYRMFFDDILRAAPYTLSPAEEKVFAQASVMGAAGGAVHSVFTNADLPYPEITLSTGEKVRLDAAGYTKYRAVSNRADREAVFKAFWDRYGEFTRTLATTLNANTQADVVNKTVHHFDTSLDAALFQYNIPRSVYTQLLADVHANLPTLHRYLKLRQKIMGLKDQDYSDLYAPIVAKADLHYPLEQAQELTLAAFAPLGPTYVETLRKGYEQRWVDFMPTTGKRSGAYSNTVYGVHPLQLLNYNGAYEDVSTLAHESGHSMHSFLSNSNQPYATAGYSIFVAEVASTLNENLLLHHMLKQTKDDRARLFLLATYLDNMRQTLFRQTLFAEFELKAHEAVERGEPLTAESLDKLYLGLLRQYYGHDQGVVRIDDRYAAEWAYIPHFYTSFYVYQYATSMIASMSLADGIIGDAAKKSGRATKNRDAYLHMLASGSAKYPIDLLKDAGVDMTTSAPFNAAIREMNSIMDQIDQIYARGQVK
ncbi:MAG TPA: oligoendopeptidase F [Steroidobacteraceae bacterium]|nr:oligoendopeptidase F [Steroidobacteraceae bacterium]